MLLVRHQQRLVLICRSERSEESNKKQDKVDNKNPSFFE